MSSSIQPRKPVPAVLAAVIGMVMAMFAQGGSPALAAGGPTAVGAAAVTAPAAIGDPGSMTLTVASARSVNTGPGFVHEGEPITTYRWMINADDTGNPGNAKEPLFDRCLPGRAQGGSSDPDYADTCPWPSVRTTSGHAPVIAQGTQDDLSASNALGGLPPGKYLISVIADGFKIDGAHFTVASGTTAPVAVRMQPTPLPLATIRIQVFNDSAPVDGTYEVGGEQGLAGFTAGLADVVGQVSTDYYGNPLCTIYQHVNANGTGPLVLDADNKPVVDTTKSTGVCTSDSTGEIVIPNLGPNRYGVVVSPPKATTGQTYQWVQTTTLEGGHDHDVWIQEGDTGYDSELTKGAEPVPAVPFGFVKTQAMAVPSTSPPTGEVKGVVVAGLPYVGGQNGQVVPETGFAGAKYDGPIPRPWVALSDLSRGDAAVYVGRGAANGSFDIKNVPDGTYQLTLWDNEQDYILWSFNVTVADGGVVDVGNKMLAGWFAHITGSVFIDSNGNGKRDSGEGPVPGFTLTIRERDNSLMDQYTNLTTTNDQGAYDIKEGYPLSKWLVLEAFNTRYETTGVTYQAANEPTPTTQLGALVDIDFLPIIGLRGRIDWGVQPYAAGSNGGIAATVSYDVTRNEFDPALAVSEDYQPGIPDVKVHLYLPVPCTATTDAEKANQCSRGYQIVPKQVPDPADPQTNITNPDPQRGALVKGAEVTDAYPSEEWAAPRGCTARDYKGAPLTDQLALPDFGTEANHLCVESPMMGVQVGPSDATPGAAGQTVNGNYGFGDLTAGDYIVSVEIPDNPVGGKLMYQVTREEDLNVFDGDTYLPQENFPPSTPALASDPAVATPAPDAGQPPTQGAGIVAPCAGALHTVHVTNQAFLDGGGSPFEGQERPLCDAKLVTVRDGQATAPNFNLFTSVPLPTHFWGLTINDLGVSLDKRSVQFGEAQGLPHVPMGIYDWSGRLVHTAHTDFNGFYEALMPSTGTFNCPVPAGPCPNMYRFVGNDPGQPGALNADYNPRFRTIGTNFQGWPGLYTVTDTAPTQAASTVLAPGTTVANPTMCDLGETYPQLLAVDKPYVRPGLASARTVTISGFGFGASGRLELYGATSTSSTPVWRPVTPATWTPGEITFVVPTNFTGPQQIRLTNAVSGRSSFNTLTLHALAAVTSGQPGASTTNPRIAEVGPGRTYATVQAALEAAVPTSTRPYWLVVVYPNASSNATPRGEYAENVIVHHQVKIQGVGPGGFRPDSTHVPGTIIDGAGFNPDLDRGAAWIALLSGLTYSGPAAVPDGAVVTVLDDPPRATVVPATYPLTIDGMSITGGSQADFPANVNTLGGAVNTPYGADGALVTQGGGVYVHANVRGLRLTDNVIVGNSGSYGGAVRVGTPYVGNNLNYNLVLQDNQIRDNGGTNLAGGIGLFTGSDGYQVTHNAICGNFSAEYGGAMTVFGYQAHFGSGSANNGGSVTRNMIWFNSSYDEGGAVMLAGELPADPTALSEGTGPATIDANTIVANLASDDGGGIRLLQVSGNHIARNRTETISITNNTIANNVSAHEGGGIALDDAAFVEIVNNTIAKNLTTATALTSDGLPAPAGLSTGGNSAPLQARLSNPAFFSGAATLAATTFSKPVLLNDVFWDNRAGSYSGGYLYGIGGTLPDGTSAGVENWDMGVVGDTGTLHPVNTVVQTTTGTDGGASMTVSPDPGLKDPFDVTVSVLASRTYPAFRQAAIITELLPPQLLGDYHLAGTGSAAYGTGAASTQVAWGSTFTQTISAPPRDIDGDPRPSATQPARYDASSDQLTP